MNFFTSLLVAAGALFCVGLLILGPAWMRRRTKLSIHQRRRLTRLMPWTRRLDPRRRERLQAHAARVLGEIEILGDAGFELSADQRLAVAGQVAMLCLGAQPSQAHLPAAIVIYGHAGEEGPNPANPGLLEDLGEMATGAGWQEFRLRVSWPAIAEALDGGPFNPLVREVVRLHDFTAPTTVTAGGQTWGDALETEWNTIRKTGSNLLPLDTDTDLEAFFGQAAEAFFQRGRTLAGAHPDLYAVLAAYFDIETAPGRPAGHRTPATGLSRS